MGATLSVADRAAAAMVGLAVGAQLGVDPVADAGSPEGLRLAPELPDSPWPAAAAIGLEAAKTFAGNAPDLRAFAIAMGDWDARFGRGASEGLRTALRALHLHFAPIDHAQEAIGEPLLVALPIGIVARASARNLASAAAHTSALLAPHPEVQQATIALAVAAGHLASGHRDFIPEVIEALKMDGASDAVLAVPRQVPLTRRDALPARLAAATPALVVLEAALWCADRESVAARGAALIAGLPLPPAVRSAACAAALGLMAMRDGPSAIPDTWRTALPMADAMAIIGRRLAP